MKYSTARQGRVFVVRLEHGEIVHEQIEKFAREKKIRAASLVVIGGAAGGSRIVVGPKRGDRLPVVAGERVLVDAHDIAGVGTIFPDEKGNPLLHMHIACGRKSSTITGCIRRGVKVWQVMEIIVFELTGTAAVRVFDRRKGFHLLEP